MTTTTRWQAPIAITGDTSLRAELNVCAKEAGTEFAFTDSVADGRKYAHTRPMIIIGADLVGRVRNPIRCGGLVLVAMVNPTDARPFVHAARIGVPYVITLPAARLWLAGQLLRGATG